VSPPRIQSLHQLQLVVWFSLLTTAGTMAGADVKDCPEGDAVALQWLDKMSRSLRQTSYQGVVTLQRDDDMQVLLITHSVEEGNSFERLTELTGQGAQVERSAHPLKCVHPGDQMLRLESLSQADRCGIAEQYRFSVAGDELVAGRNAIRIIIKPRDMYRFGYVMALDQETGLLLKSQTIHHGQRTLETMQFAHVSYSDAIPEMARGQVVHEALHSEPDETASNTSVARPWTVGWLPHGFAPTDATLGNNRRRTYTDGLAVFSVFLEDISAELVPGEGLVRQGGTMTYTRGRNLAGEPVLVTVIGEVPVNTARMVADSVQWEQ
jgi:sigma-E factor negative regulatory protein RseB